MFPFKKWLVLALASTVPRLGFGRALSFLAPALLLDRDKGRKGSEGPGNSYSQNSYCPKAAVYVQ